MKRALLAAVTGALLLQLQQGAPLSAQAPDALTFFKNYFITGDYVVGGVGLRGQGVNGTATGAITIAGVPEGADVVAAFLYWQVVLAADNPDAGSVPVTFNHHPLSSAEGPFGKVIGAETARSCWSGPPEEVDNMRRNYSFRADVLRLFDIDETTGKFIVNGSHQVQLPDGPQATALGATVVVLYRDSTLPLSAIVMYDGGYTMDWRTPPMSQQIEGFYQPATPAARLTHIVGGGRLSGSQRLRFNGASIAANPFRSVLGPSWDNPSFDVTSPTALAAVNTSVDPLAVNAPDCMTWSAVIYKTAVQDSDRDGLLDIWESSPIALVDPQGNPLPLLSQMGADPNRKDLFIETGFMHTEDDLAYGGSVRPAHTHEAGHEALKLVGDAFKNAPEPIAVHFDLGPAYPGPEPGGVSAEAYIIRGAHARGGEAINELATVCEPGAADAPWVCQFSEYPGTVGWKTGFRFLRDEVLSVTPPQGAPAPPAGEEFCAEPGYTCTRRFDRNRKDMFRYALFAHALGLPKSEDPASPEFHIPRTNTGVGDFPGGDLMLTLGAFLDVEGKPVGTPFMQASTLMHEVGHLSERRHGGEAFEPNCKPTYLSVMNYLYQLRGLLDDDGKPHLGFSAQVYAPVDETFLSDGSLGFLPYRIGWYAPLAGSYLDGFGQAATKHCDGTDLLPTDVPTVRIDTRTAAADIDWHANSVLDLAFSLDVNFNGRTLRADGSPDILAGSNDWANVVLNQVGARRNPGGLFVDGGTGLLAMGPLSLDSGRGDLGRGDLGRGDLGRGDLGRGDLGRGDLGRGDLGRGDLGRGDLGNPALGRGDLGRGDLGGGDLFANDPNNPAGELDFETATSLAKAPPIEFSACVFGVDCGIGVDQAGAVMLAWKAPNVGGVGSYVVYRVPGATIDPGDVWTVVGQVASVIGQLDYSTLDTGLLTAGEAYTYFVVSIYDDGTRSDPSNFDTIVAINGAPTISDIADQTIDANTSTGPLSFTIGDDQIATVTVAGTSSRTTLVPNADIVFGGSGSDRTVTVAPVVNRIGTAVITVTVTDAGGRTASDSFLLTVKEAVVTYIFTGFGTPLKPAGTDAAPTDSGAHKFGKALPIKWQLKVNGSFSTDLTSLKALEAVPGTLLPGGVCSPTDGPALQLLDEVTGRPTGNSTYRVSGSQFVFNWDTSAADKTRCYRLRLRLVDDSPARVTIIRFK